MDPSQQEAVEGGPDAAIPPPPAEPSDQQHESDVPEPWAVPEPIPQVEEPPAAEPPPERSTGGVILGLPSPRPAGARGTAGSRKDNASGSHSALRRTTA